MLKLRPQYRGELWLFVALMTATLGLLPVVAATDVPLLLTEASESEGEQLEEVEIDDLFDLDVATDSGQLLLTHRQHGRVDEELVQDHLILTPGRSERGPPAC